MTNSRIFLERHNDTVWSDKTSNFHNIHQVQIRAKDEEEAQEIAEHVAEQFGEEIEFSHGDTE